jgi:hypothetical protein
VAGRGTGGGAKRGGQAGQCGKEWEASWPSSACSYQQGLAPAGVDTRLAAGRAGRQSTQPSWSCWEPARAAASRAVCAAEGATHPLAYPGGSRWRNQLALRACQPQPQPAPVRATPARSGACTTGALLRAAFSGSKACSCPPPQHMVSEPPMQQAGAGSIPGPCGLFPPTSICWTAKICQHHLLALVSASDWPTT